MTKREIDLKKCLQEKTVLLLGAGASVDYGFPLWEELKPIYKNLVNVSMSPSFFGEHAGAEYWRTSLSNMSDIETVDKLALNASDQGITLFQLMTLQTFAEFETIDLSTPSNGWVENFTDAYISLLEDNPRNTQHIKPLLENLSVISLNYDRSFAYRFAPKVNDFKVSAYPNKFIRNSIIQGIKWNNNIVVQPHGSLGNIPRTQKAPLITSINNHFNSNAEVNRKYGEPFQAFTNQQTQSTRALEQQAKQLMPVDLLHFAPTNMENGAYSHANSLLHTAKNVIIIGMSEEGFSQSLLRVPPMANVTATGKLTVKNNFVNLACKANEIIWKT